MPWLKERIRGLSSNSHCFELSRRGDGPNGLGGRGGLWLPLKEGRRGRSGDGSSLRLRLCRAGGVRRPSGGSLRSSHLVVHRRFYYLSQDQLFKTRVVPTSHPPQCSDQRGQWGQQSSLASGLAHVFGDFLDPQCLPPSRSSSEASWISFFPGLQLGPGPVPAPRSRSPGLSLLH